MVNTADCAAYVWARKTETHRTRTFKKEDAVQPIGCVQTDDAISFSSYMTSVALLSRLETAAAPLPCTICIGRGVLLASTVASYKDAHGCPYANHAHAGRRHTYSGTHTAAMAHTGTQAHRHTGTQTHRQATTNTKAHTNGIRDVSSEVSGQSKSPTLVPQNPGKL